jgi:hypothetical protein
VVEDASQGLCRMRAASVSRRDSRGRLVVEDLRRLRLGRAGRHRIQPSTCGPSSNTQVPSSNRQTAMSASTGPSHVKQGSAAPR